MSLLDKINDSVSETNDTDDLYNTQYKELEEQLNNANVINTKNIEEINELKALLNEYTNQMINLKQSYTETINDLKSQLNFEKEINEKYLSKLIESNNSLDENIKSLNSRYEKDNKELLSLFNTNQDVTNSTNEIVKQLSDAKDNQTEVSVEMESFKNVLSESNIELLKNVSEILENNNNSSQILSELDNHKNSIEEINSQNKKLIGLEELIKNNYQDLSNLINKNYDNQNTTTSKIIEKLHNVNSNHSNISNDEIDSVKELINDNKKHLVDFSKHNKELQENITNKIIDEISKNSTNSISNDVISQINDSIKANNQQLIEELSMDNNTKVDILNKISDDLSNGHYTNLKAYKKIKELDIFDEDYYRNTYGYNLDIDPLLHYIYKGFEENKNPNSEFNNSYYIKSDSNIEKSSLNPLVYFVSTGIKEGNIQINDGIEQIDTINKFDIDNEIKNFDIRGVKKSKRKPRIIVSLASSPENIDDVHYTLYSLLNQQVKPDKVILWLNESDFPEGEYDLPKTVLKLKKNGLTIRFTENYKSYNKIIPTLKTYPNDIVVIAEDNIYYPQNWLKILYESYKNNEENVIAHNVCKISLDDDGNVDSLIKSDNNEPSVLNFINQSYGVLYPPHSFSEDVFNIESFMDLCEDSEDIWLWAMAVLNDKKIILANDALNTYLTYINPVKELNIFGKEVYSSINKKVELKNIIEAYPEILSIIKNE